jgi:pimeloyl-ACP methyl ester carboxylesterase
VSSVSWVFIGVAVVVLTAIVAFLLYIHIRYTPKITRIFEEKPMFLPLRVTPTGEGEEVTFRTRDGLSLVGTYLKTRAPRRLGVIVFCHEYLSDRWSLMAYADHLRDQGFDLFAFDFRNHGKSDHDPSYKPLQWVTDHELRDLRAALTYLRTRPDADPAGFGLYGISRGGGTALCVGGKDPGVWGVLTDGAFPTRGTMLAYIIRWAEIYVGSKTLWRHMPTLIFEFLGWTARKRSQARLKCRFPDVERATARLAPRPLFMIHGQKDAYIGPEIAEGLFDVADEPKELWIVPKAKHNRCREIEGAAYLERVAAFFLSSAPRVSTSPSANGLPSMLNREAMTKADVAVPVPSIVSSAHGGNVLSH